VAQSSGHMARFSLGCTDYTGHMPLARRCCCCAPPTPCAERDIPGIIVACIIKGSELLSGDSGSVIVAAMCMASRLAGHGSKRASGSIPHPDTRPHTPRPKTPSSKPSAILN
jgi:hypothetical protein